MTHTPEVLETKEINDEQVAYRIRCCGDVTTDSWHTISVLCPTTEDPRTHEQQLEERKADVATKHEAKITWRAKQPSARPSTSST
jgi:hypothetical protein